MVVVPVPDTAWLKPALFAAAVVVTLFAAFTVTWPNGVLPPTMPVKVMLPVPAVIVSAWLPLTV